MVRNLVPRRLQYITTDKDGIFITLYAQSGSQGERERRVLLGQDLLPLVQSAPIRPTIVGDWNCVVHRKEVESHGGVGWVLEGQLQGGKLIENFNSTSKN